ncbi:TPA: hypothetical protein NKO89_001416 [Vibrio parahaemolyticus]|nr:hypothetical protein [Vibrio parahaemolyticus]HCH0717416.1 hypothetical protein [Vibrio parahaemolyticus]HCM1318394.1 hypothetical protein [Vibrio parahaemolyticus]
MAGSNFRIGEMETTVVYDGEEYSYISVIELGRNNQKVVQMFCDPNGYGDGEIVGTGLTQPIELSVKLRNVSQQHCYQAKPNWNHKMLWVCVTFRKVVSTVPFHGKCPQIASGQNLVTNPW